ncbi:PIN domain-like protein [Trametes meyenii]|nr:PIN domain-like protein [Trametes meyenii]
MGVLGLTPFIQKVCPEVVQTIPGRFKYFSGKRIVIDGTLVTQRFHFAPFPHPHRHVLGWYRLINHLRAAHVQTLCVFDGSQRNAAKKREVERRRQDRILVAARGAFEVDRLSRLRKLSEALQAWRASDSDRELAQQLASLKGLVGSMRKPTEPPLFRSPITQTNPPIDTPPRGSAQLSNEITQRVLRLVLVRLQKICSAWNSIASDTDRPFEVSRGKNGPPEIEDPLVIKELDRRPSTDRPSNSDGSGADILPLFLEYQHSIPRIASLAQNPPINAVPPAATRTPMHATDFDNAQADYALSKGQQDLAVEEGKLWQQLAELNDFESIGCTLTSLAQALEAKSSILSESYSRRTYAPTAETYDQSKEILRAMGIPCINSSGPFEAEALAASMVLNGQADYVASEDTDVLVYEAPLIRNIASASEPLQLISGAEVRSALELDRTSYIDFALLLGTDFSQRIKNVGPARALKFIREHGSIERVLERETQYPPRVALEEYLHQIQLARQVFQTLPPAPDSSLLQQRDVDEESVRAIMDEYNLGRYVMSNWDPSQALVGNYFADNPAAA